MGGAQGAQETRAFFVAYHYTSIDLKQAPHPFPRRGRAGFADDGADRRGRIRYPSLEGTMPSHTLFFPSAGGDVLNWSPSLPPSAWDVPRATTGAPEASDVPLLSPQDVETGASGLTRFLGR